MKGNKFYTRGNDCRSIELYNKSIILAPHGSDVMALALANRSAVLSRLKFFQEALNDIEMALEYNYPEDKRPKLLLRKANLLMDLNRKSEGDDVLNQLKDLEICKSKIKLKEELVNNCGSITSSPGLQNTIEELPNVLLEENVDFKNASNKLQIKYSKKKGRHVVTNSDVIKDEVLFVEKPFALIVLPEQTNKHCHHCCKILYAPIACAECTEALYCSNTCRLDSWRLYHQWECGGLQMCYSIGIAHLGLRLSLLAQTSQNSENYQQVYNLLSHTEKMLAEDLYQYTLTAALLTLYLEQKSNFFPVSVVKTEVEAMGGRILTHIAQLICNAHAITKVDVSDIVSNNVVEETQQRVATAIYPSASMMNHSCNSNIYNSFINDMLVVKASRNIKMGEEVFNCYGPDFRRMEVNERQQILQSQYFFTCECDKCTSLENKNKYSALKCETCEGPVYRETVHCASCNAQQPIIKLMNLSLEACRLAEQGKELSSQGKYKAAIDCFMKCLDLSDKCLFQSNFDIIQYKDLLAKNFVILGNYDKGAFYIEQCLPLVKERFGGKSTEVTTEYLKLLHVRIMQFKMEENRKIHKKIEHLLKEIESNSNVLSDVQKREFNNFKSLLLNDNNL